MDLVVDRVALGQVLMHKHEIETEVATPLISNKNFNILLAFLELLNVDGQTNTLNRFRFAPSHYQKLSTAGARDVDIKDKGRCLWASLIKHHGMKWRSTSTIHSRSLM